MIEIPRSLARTIRAVFRRLAPKGATPAVSFMAGIGGLFVRLHRTDILGEYHLEGDRQPEELAIPFNAFAAFEGRDGVVTLESTDTGVQARWTDAGVPQLVDYDGADTAKPTPYPVPPETLVGMPERFMTALADASQCAAPDNPRYAITHLQLRGANGTIVGTDGRHLLTQSGFPFPWQDDVLIPASTVFGSKELQGQPVQIGRTDTHVVPNIGPWRFSLPIDKTGRYPHTDEVIPKASKVASMASLDPEDITYLVRALPRLPGGDDDDAPVTIDLGEIVHIRACGQTKANLTEVALSRSTCTGESVRLCVNRGFLQQALRFGFSQLEVVNADTPMRFKDDQRQYIVMPLPKESALATRDDAIRLSTTEAPTNHQPMESIPVNETVPHANGSTKNGTAANGQTVALDTANGTASVVNVPRRRKAKNSGIAALIAEAEALKTSLRAAFSRSHALLIALKKHRKQSQIVQTTLKSLKELQSVE